jgi:CubicO group peptidase (beta-lactamase class C family)
MHRWAVVAMAASLATGAHAQPLAGRNPFAALEDGLRPNVVAPGRPLPRWSLRERMAHHKVPGVAIAILKNGELVEARGFGVREAGTRDQVDGDTLFSVGSISKVVTAATSLRLVAQQRVELDRNVDAYLKRWKLPATPELPRPHVTLRMLMSHTAGFNVHGFEDYQPSEPLPTLLQVLEGQAPAKNEAVRFKHAPGAQSDYSGGGVSVEQMVLEDVTGRSLAALASDEVFAPLGMRRSTFANPLPPTQTNVAKAHDGQGARKALPRGWESFPESGASGLWTSAYDLGRFMSGLIRSYQGASDFLPQPLAAQMMTEVSPAAFGLGPRLGGVGRNRFFFHMGANDSYLAFMEGYPETGDGFVILTNGANGGALLAEIRNALADAVGAGAHPPVYAVGLRGPPAPDYAGRYRLDPAAPMDLRRSLADSLEAEVLDVRVDQTTVTVATSASGRPAALLPLGPGQFVQDGLYTYQFEFRRDPFGKVRALSVSLPEANSFAYYVKE